MLRWVDCLAGITEEPMFAGIYGQLDSAIVREYLRNPEDAVILNVIPVTTLDVSLCSEFVDQKSHGHWKRTLAVVTIGDDEDAIELPEMWKWHGEQRLGDLGYVCVRYVRRSEHCPKDPFSMTCRAKVLNIGQSEVLVTIYILEEL